MRILHVFDHSIPLHSGYTFRSQAILREQRALGWETDHVTSPKHNDAIQPKADEELIDDLHFFRTEPAGGLLAGLPVLNQWAVIGALEGRLEQAVDSVSPDIIHAHSPALNGKAAARVARRRGIPLVYEVRAFWEDAAVDHGTSREGGLRYRLTRALESSVLREADYVTTICEGLRSDMAARGIGEDKITVIPNAVDIEKFTFDRPRDQALVTRLGLDGRVVLGFIGSFYAYEGLPLLIEAMACLGGRIPEVHLLLVGGGPQDDTLRGQVRQLGLEDRVTFTGRVPHDEVQAYYSLVDVFVYPRLPMRLTDLVTPLKPLEAMAQGKLVVASDVGGHKELIRHGETGDLFRAGDAGALCDTVARLVEDRASWPARRQAGRRFVEEERNWQRSVSRYIPIYESLLGR